MVQGILGKIKSTERHILREGKNDIGRSSTCAISISEDVDISRKHAVVEKNKDEFLVYDTGSKHGTWWRKKGLFQLFSRLPAGTKKVLNDGDLVRFGHIEYEFTISESHSEEWLPDNIVTSDVSFYRIDDELDDSEHEFSEIIGTSHSLKRTLKSARKIASADLVSILITGETGTGKSLLARVIHDQSPRRNINFVTLNCAGISTELANSELFGHEKGAFTGALKQRFGYFERANGGTLFLDEIGDMSFDTQSKLLRILESGEFERVGGEHTLKVDVRIIAATNRDLEKAMKEKLFREDLYYRIKGCEIELPPLRKRKDDLPLLIHHFTKKFGEKLNVPSVTLTDEALKTLQEYHWPGNIRELCRLLQSAMVCAEESLLDVELFNLLLQSKTKGSPENETKAGNLNSEIQVLMKNEIKQGKDPKVIERKIDYLFAKSALEYCSWNKSEVQRVFGMSRTTLDKRLGYEGELS